jgi:hypothetical protein
MSFGLTYLDTLCRAKDVHYRGMSEIDSSRRTEALDHVSQALALLERVQIRWRRYTDTTPFANAAEPIEMVLRTAKNILTKPTDAHLADTSEMLLGVIMAMRKIKRDELRSVIEKTQAAYEAVLDRQ